MKRNAVTLLPEPLRRELDQRIVSGRFSGYSDFAAWLAEEGFEISKSAVHRYGQALERRIEAVRLATEQAEALVAAAPDDMGAVADAILRLSQQKILDVLIASESGDLKEIASACRAAADTARAGTMVRQERRRAVKDAADAATGAARKKGVPADAVAAIREAIEGAGEAA
ncbi:MAG: DUF3486 family protein [Deltaproteobacteria bacterium]|nr:DUF3486 family protein [Deltaproteobacteria bacterium]